MYHEPNVKKTLNDLFLTNYFLGKYNETSKDLSTVQIINCQLSIVNC